MWIGDVFFEDIFNMSGDGVFVTDHLGNILLANNALCAITGYSQEELAGIRGSDLLAPDFVPARDQVFADFCKLEKSSVEAAYIRKDGSRVPVELKITNLPVSSGKHAPGIIVSVRDITERKNAEQELKLAHGARFVAESALTERAVEQFDGDPALKLSVLTKIDRALIPRTQNTPRPKSSNLLYGHDSSKEIPYSQPYRPAPGNLLGGQLDRASSSDARPGAARWGRMSRGNRIRRSSKQGTDQAFQRLAVEFRQCGEIGPRMEAHEVQSGGQLTEPVRQRYGLGDPETMGAGTARKPLQPIRIEQADTAGAGVDNHSVQHDHAVDVTETGQQPAARTVQLDQLDAGQVQIREMINRLPGQTVRTEGRADTENADHRRRMSSFRKWVAQEMQGS